MSRWRILEPARRQLAPCVDGARAAVAERTEKITSERRQGWTPRPTTAKAFAHLAILKTSEILLELTQRDPGLYERAGKERTIKVDRVPA